MSEGVKVVHVITGLDTGGAETMLYRLLSRMDRSRFSNAVISLSGRGKLGDAIEKLQVPVVSLEMANISGFIGGLIRLVREIRQFRPHVIQTWLYHADLAGLVAHRFIADSRLCWNLRCAVLNRGDVSSSTLALRRILSLFAGVPDLIMVNSDSGRRAHQELGYQPRRWEVIYNGFDTESCRPDPAARVAVRKELGLPNDAQLVGLIARFDPLKDHANFIRAAGLMVAGRPHVRFILAGRGVDIQNTSITSEIQNANLNGRCFLLGERADVPKIMAALDLAVSSSYSEGFPNTIGEAMACGIPCVATDAGDSASLLGETGLIVPTRDSRALARACETLLDLDAEQRSGMGKAARDRIERLFSLQTVTERYERIYEELGNQ